MAQISLRVDDEVKRRAEQVCEEIFYSKENIEELERRINDVRSGKSTLKEHDLIEAD